MQVTKMQVLTDIQLRAGWFKNRQDTWCVPEGTMLTPAAKDFIKEHGITITYGNAAGGCRQPLADGEKRTAGFGSQPANALRRAGMPVQPIPKAADGKAVYVDESGHTFEEKPENMTHLHGNVLVPKSHPQIAFRGMLDSLEARIIAIQAMAAGDGLTQLTESLGQVLDFVRSILSAEVRETPMADISLLGMDSEGLRYESHHIKEIYGIPHPMPDYHMGRICVALNELRTLAREAELSAVNAFGDGESCTRPDIIEAMNRLSSVIYILLCRQLTGKWAAAPAQDLPGFMVEASGRHVHLTQEAIDVLFGGPLHERNALSQPGQYAAEERVRLVTPKGEIDGVVVLGPPRGEIQVELSLTDARLLGINIPINLSGDLKGAGDVILVGPKGIYNAPGSAIAAKAHIHMTPADAALYGVEDGDSVAVRVGDERPVIFDDVIIRVSDKFALAMHMDYDEANASSYKKGDLGYIIR